MTNLAFNHVVHLLAKVMLWMQRTQHIEAPLMRSLCPVTAPTLHLQHQCGFMQGLGNAAWRVAILPNHHFHLCSILWGCRTQWSFVHMAVKSGCPTNRAKLKPDHLYPIYFTCNPFLRPLPKQHILGANPSTDCSYCFFFFFFILPANRHFWKIWLLFAQYFMRQFLSIVS